MYRRKPNEQEAKFEAFKEKGGNLDSRFVQWEMQRMRNGRKELGILYVFTLSMRTEREQVPLSAAFRELVWGPGLNPQHRKEGGRGQGEKKEEEGEEGD